MEDLQYGSIMGFEPTRKKYFVEDARAFFWNRAVYAAIKLSLLDCRFCLITQPQDGVADNSVLLKEVKDLARAMDNYAVYQMCGWYAICDTKFNKMCTRLALRDSLENELRVRTDLLGAIKSESSTLQESMQAWVKSIEDLFAADFEALEPCERYLQADLAARILASAGNDWEFLVTFVLGKFEEHHRANAIASLAMDFQTVLKKCTVVENDRIRNAFFASLSHDMRKRVLQIGFDMTEPTGAHGVAEDDALHFKRSGSGQMSDLFPVLHRRSSTVDSARSPPTESSRDPSTGFGRTNSSLSPFLSGISLYESKRAAAPGLPRQKSKAAGSRGGADASVAAAAAAVKNELDAAAAISAA